MKHSVFSSFILKSQVPKIRYYIMVCPKCSSENIQAVTVQKTKSDTTSKTKGFGCIKAMFGFLLFQWWGLLCGLCGMGKEKNRTATTTTTEIQYCCLDCGNQFKK